MIAIFDDTDYLFFDLESEGEDYNSPETYDVVLTNNMTGTTYSVTNITPTVATDRYFKLDISSLDANAPDGYYDLVVNINGGSTIYSEIAMIIKTTSVAITENEITTTYAVNEI